MCLFQFQFSIYGTVVGRPDAVVLRVDAFVGKRGDSAPEVHVVYPSGFLHVPVGVVPVEGPSRTLAVFFSYGRERISPVFPEMYRCRIVRAGIEISYEDCGKAGRIVFIVFFHDDIHAIPARLFSERSMDHHDEEILACKAVIECEAAGPSVVLLLVPCGTHDVRGLGEPEIVAVFHCEPCRIVDDTLGLVSFPVLGIRAEEPPGLFVGVAAYEFRKFVLDPEVGFLYSEHVEVSVGDGLCKQVFPVFPGIFVLSQIRTPQVVASDSDGLVVLRTVAAYRQQ